MDVDLCNTNIFHLYLYLYFEKKYQNITVKTKTRTQLIIMFLNKYILDRYTKIKKLFVFHYKFGISVMRHQ